MVQIERKTALFLVKKHCILKADPSFCGHPNIHYQPIQRHPSEIYDVENKQFHPMLHQHVTIYHYHEQFAISKRIK